MNYNDHIRDEDIEWTKESVIGLVVQNAEFDSHMNPINIHAYYKVGKHIPSGFLIIIPDERMSSISEFWNDMLKKQDRLN